MRRYWPLFAAAISSPAIAQLDPPAWTRPTNAFPIAPNIWYVGTEGLAAYLIKTADGAILIDATMAENVPAVERSIAATGAKLSDVKIILVSHAHFDHVGGVAALAKATGAQVMVGQGDLAALQTGIPPGETSYGVVKFPAVTSAKGIADGAQITLGGIALTAIATPGHTPGCTSYRMKIGTKTALFACSLTVAGNKLVGNARYPTIVRDFRYSFGRMRAERPDYLLPFHPELADLIGRWRRGATLVQPELFVPSLFKAHAAFEAELTKQDGAKP